MKIALIEDEPDCYENYQVLLESRGHVVVVFCRADDVINKMDEVVRFDIVILDLMMQLGSIISPAEGIETGTALYRRIRKAAPTLPILVLTARSKSEVWQDFEMDKLVRYLGKPVSDVAVLYEAVEKPGIS